MSLRNPPVTESLVDDAEEYRAKIEAAFGEAVPAEYDENGQCTLCAEMEGERCPGWHSPVWEGG